MTRDEAKSILFDMLGDTTIIEPTEQNQAILTAIKALEQQDIFDKIRAEIEQVADKQFQIAMGVADLNERYTHIQMENAYRHSLNIIDKYKAESEEEE